ncbi:hypothetical protein [Halobaculum rarum]|uniref:hypothetical protein n=1 Tax=Halobaculum rarum TaxID=3075122 RepID=UPI0032AF638A
MTAQSSAAERVREALRSLAVDPNPRAGDSGGSTRRTTDAQRDLVAEAERALATVRTAAAFADDDGFQRTGRVAETTADPALARRARAVIETIERYRAAYRDAVPADSVDSATSVDTADPADTTDHFHSARDRHIPAAEQPEDN